MVASPFLFPHVSRDLAVNKNNSLHRDDSVNRQPGLIYVPSVCNYVQLHHKNKIAMAMG